MSCFHPFIYLPLHSSIYSFIHSSIHSSIHHTSDLPFIWLSIFPFIYSSIHPSIHPSFIQPSIYISFLPFIHPALYLRIPPFIHPSSPLSTYLHKLVSCSQHRCYGYTKQCRANQNKIRHVCHNKTVQVEKLQKFPSKWMWANQNIK